MKTILLLDDDSEHLQQLAAVLEENGYATASCINVSEALAALSAQRIDFAIVDLFLSGEDGDELSNNFVREFLEPAGIPYGRMSSAPGLVPQECSGCWVYNKRKFRGAPSDFLQLLAD